MNRPTTHLVNIQQRWSSSDYPPVPVIESEFAVAEACLSWRFPGTYRNAVLEVGLPRLTTDLWEAIDEADANLAHLGDFFTPTEAVERTQAWTKLGMPEDLIAFAADSGGNLFAFSRIGGDAVWLFHHEFGSVDQLAPSFEVWLASYCSLAKG